MHLNGAHSKLQNNIRMILYTYVGRKGWNDVVDLFDTNSNDVLICRINMSFINKIDYLSFIYNNS